MQTAVGTAKRNVTVKLPVKDNTGYCAVIFVGDTIDGVVKSANPDWAMGGTIRGDYFTLKYQHGFIRRCEITALRPQMISELAAYVQPELRGHLAPTIDMDDGETIRRLGTTKYTDKERMTANEGATHEKHDGLLRTMFYPIDEIGKITSQVDGLVRVPCTNETDALKAQYLLFPDWDEIVAGRKELPTKLAALEAHFKTRLAATEQGSWEESVVNAALKSCADFRDWGSKETTAANATFRAMSQKGYAWPFSGTTEGIFDQLGIQRQDTVQQEQADKLDKLTDNISRFVEVATAGKGDTPPLNEERLAAFFAWEASQLEVQKAEQAKAKVVSTSAVTPTIPPMKEGDAVIVDGRVGSVVKNRGLNFDIKFADGEETSVHRSKVNPIPEG